jgi:hypothetical protein
MSFCLIHRWPTAGLLAVVLAVVGCARQQATVEGKLLSDGHPYQLAPGGQLLLALQSVNSPAEQSFSGSVKSDGTFRAAGIGSAGIPPGQYRITIRSLSYGPGVPSDAGDKFAGALSSPQSPLTCEVPHQGVLRVVIDVKRKTVTTE